MRNGSRKRTRAHAPAALAVAMAAALLLIAGDAPLRRIADASPQSPPSAASPDERRAASAALDRAADFLASAGVSLLSGVGDPAADGVADARDAIIEASAAVTGRRRGDVRFRAACDAARRRCEAAIDGLGETDAAGALDLIRDCATATRRAARTLGPAGVLRIVETRSVHAMVRRPGQTLRIRVVEEPGCDERPVVGVANDDPLVLAIEGAAEDLGGGRHRVRFGPDAGTAAITASACGRMASLRVVNRGGDGALDVEPPRVFSYAAGIAVRVGDDVDVAAIYAGGAATFSVSPALPAGLAIDAESGAIRGTPDAVAAPATYTVVARNSRSLRRATISIGVEEALPDGVVRLEAGFRIERVTDADTPVRLAIAPDGRVFYGELLSGNVRVLDASGALLPTPYATLPVLTGGERGLLGICLAPDFATSGHLYVAASAAAGDGRAARNRVVRFTGTGNTAASGPDVIVDDLPIGDTQNGGAVEFGPDGMLYVTTGDTGDMLLAQDDASLAGRILRFAPDGAIPADGPVAGSPEFARGFRNPFDITFHPVTGGLFATENGPTAHDELDFVQRGKNFEWGAEPEAIPGPFIGRRIIDWTPVIVPTGIVFHDGTGFGAEYADNLFIAGYDLGDVRRVVVSGPAFSDLDAELPFLAFDEAEFGHKPLDIQRAPDGSLWVATFTAIWRISRNAP